MTAAIRLLLALAAAPQDGTELARLAGETALPVPDRSELERWRAHVRPGEDELRFETPGWIPSFIEGMRRASAEERPLLLWAMNGHPLGCT